MVWNTREWSVELLLHQLRTAMVWDTGGGSVDLLLHQLRTAMVRNTGEGYVELLLHQLRTARNTGGGACRATCAPAGDCGGAEHCGRERRRWGGGAARGMEEVTGGNAEGFIHCQSLADNTTIGSATEQLQR